MLSDGGEVRGQSDLWARFGFFEYDQTSGQWVFSARRWDNLMPSAICELKNGLFKYDDIQSSCVAS